MNKIKIAIAGIGNCASAPDNRAKLMVEEFIKEERER